MNRLKRRKKAYDKYIAMLIDDINGQDISREEALTAVAILGCGLIFKIYPQTNAEDAGKYLSKELHDFIWGAMEARRDAGT